MTGAKGVHLRRSRMELMYLRCCLLLQYQIQRGAREEPGTFVMGRLVRTRLGSSSLIAHVLHYLPLPSRTAL
jgi:hypothetical protein